MPIHMLHKVISYSHQGNSALLQLAQKRKKDNCEKSRKRNAKVRNNKLDKEMARRVGAEALQIAKVCAEIASRTDFMHNTRWGRPDQIIRISRTLDMANKNAFTKYIPTLEHTFDLLNVYTHSLINYLEQIPQVKEYFTPINIVRPTDNHLQLRTLTYMLWCRIKFVYDLINKKSELQTDYKQTALAIQTTQTETVSLRSCENCSICKNLIIDLIDTVHNVCQKHDLKRNYLMEAKEEMKNNIYNVTQWAAITKWSEAINNDVKSISNLAYELLNVNNELHTQVENLKNQISEHEATKQNLIEDVIHEKSKGEDTIDELKKELSDERAKVNEFKEKCISLSREINSKKIKTDLLESTLDKVKEDAEKKVFQLKDEIATKDVIHVSLNKKIQELEIVVKTLEKDETVLKERIETQQRYEMELWKNYNEILEENQNLKEMIKRKNEVTNLTISKSLENLENKSPINEANKSRCSSK